MRDHSVLIILAFFQKMKLDWLLVMFWQLNSCTERRKQCLSAFWGPSGLICIFFSRGRWIKALFSLIAEPCVYFFSCNSLVYVNWLYNNYLLSFFVSKKELASLGLDRLKQALQALGLKCGGYVLIKEPFKFCLLLDFQLNNWLHGHNVLVVVLSVKKLLAFVVLQFYTCFNLHSIFEIPSFYFHLSNIIIH